MPDIDWKREQKREKRHNQRQGCFKARRAGCV